MCSRACRANGRCTAPLRCDGRALRPRTAYNATNPFALPAGTALGRKAGKAGKISYVLCHQPKSFDWRARGAKRHAQGRLADAVFGEACAVLNQIIGIE